MTFSTSSIIIMGFMVALYVFLLLDRLKRKSSAQHFEQGYEFAKQMLLKDVLSRSQLLDFAGAPSTVSDFDRGIRQAVSDYTHDKWKIEDLKNSKGDVDEL